MILQKRDGKNFSEDTEKEKEIRKILVQTLNKIDKNFDMNASKRGTLAITKEEYKKDFINAISNLNDIIYD